MCIELSEGAKFFAAAHDGAQESRVGDDYPTLSEQVLDIPKTQAESVIESDGLAADLKRVAVALVGNLVSVHVPSLTAASST